LLYMIFYKNAFSGTETEGSGKKPKSPKGKPNIARKVQCRKMLLRLKHCGMRHYSTYHITLHLSSFWLHAVQTRITNVN